MDIKIFHKNDGGIVQLIEKEKIEEWSTELPFIFVEYIRTKLRSYRDAKVQDDISQYLDDILKTIGEPGLKKVIEGNEKEDIISLLTKFEGLSENNVEAARHITPFLPGLTKNSDKTITNLARNISNNLKG